MSQDAESFELALYLVSCARRCLEEPLIYASARMIEATSKLGGFAADAYVADSKEAIDREKWKVMGDREGYVAWLDELARQFAAEAKRRNLDEAAG